MVVVRRAVLRVLVGGFVAAAVSARSLSATTKGAPSVTKLLPSFELQGGLEPLASLGADIAAYSVVQGGSTTYAVWLKSKDGRIRFLGVDRREPLPMFEVFTLAIATLEELEARWRDWSPPTLPHEIPEPFRTMAMTRPSAPAAPTNFEPWPFDHWQTQVLRRAEFIVENVPVDGTVGSSPNIQSAARPTRVPSEASAGCEVAAGLLFTGANSNRLLIGVDWMPECIVVTDEAAKIEEYLRPCEKVELTPYLKGLSKLA